MVSLPMAFVEYEMKHPFIPRNRSTGRYYELPNWYTANYEELVWKQNNSLAKEIQ
jgi:hypothetical protein